MNKAQYHTESDDLPGSNSEFEDLYMDVRRLEKRVFSDNELMFLPDIDPSHIHYHEWQMRKRSSQRLITYLTKKNKPLKILEIGCGNGWLSSKLSSIENTKVIGLDVNQVEILQANRVFKKNNLEFVCGNFNAGILGETEFDIVLLAAAIQYFPSVNSILKNTLDCLSENGEVHIMDTPFYNPKEIDSAKQRAKSYFAMLGYPEMAAYYFYHSLNDIKKFNYKILLNPGNIINRISKKQAFYWMAVTH